MVSGVLMNVYSQIVEFSQQTRLLVAFIILAPVALYTPSISSIPLYHGCQPVKDPQ